MRTGDREGTWVMSRRFWVISLPLAAAVLLVAAAPRAVAQAPAPAGQAEERTGERILNASCTGACHDVWPIQSAAKSEDEWEQTIENMLAMGAFLEEGERPVLVEYLVRFHGPMPDGDGKGIVLNTCTICHDLTRVKRGRHTPEEWRDILLAMLNEGAPLSDEDFPVVLLYLARNFGI